MQKPFNRRQIIKFFLKIGLSLFTFSYGAKKILKKSVSSKPMKTIKQIMDLPESGPWPTTDPFLFCVHHNDKYPKATKNFTPDAPLKGRNLGNDFSNKGGWSMYHGESVPGFPKHPHRGFETLTVINKGTIDHADSLGATARYGDGDAQWLTAGDGINHSEMFPLFNKQSNNILDFFQIWINLPSYNKRVEPNFQMYWNKQIPKVNVKDKAGIISSVKLISGKFEGKEPQAAPANSWANDINNHFAVWIINLKSNGSFLIPKTKEGISRSIYIQKNTHIKVNNFSIPPHSMVELFSEQDVYLKNNKHNSRILLLQGRPINEPIEKYGPFVMNTKSEIQEAFKDYHRTGFGGWKWTNSGPTHGQYNGRFAKLINGEIDKPG